MGALAVGAEKDFDHLASGIRREVEQLQPTGVLGSWAGSGGVAVGGDVPVLGTRQQSAQRDHGQDAKTAAGGHRLDLSEVGGLWGDQQD
ncbi:hypothetical protein [Streptomyces yunnanensis]|uniref:Uncharacterized protein n=2 Tax=Streptomyces TaxID=1883 RepID=A0A2N8PB14_STRNR|nr:hypothetical protein [Streptomyces yunnanensis]PNE38182.1 hypothetical protein AOB60_29280 [Streptomyces noursei]SHL82009.1 hypothetical protein SAMN05216268_106306 [Streptomyces yunnanensis]